MNVIIYYSNIPPDASLDELDVLDELAFFKSQLEQLAYKVFAKPFPFDYKELLTDKKTIEPVFIVNLVETIFNDGRLIHVAPAFFDFLGIPYTGCSSEAIYLTSNKITTKTYLKVNGINHPTFITANNIDTAFKEGTKYLIKSVWEHASIGLDEEKICLLDSKGVILSKLKFGIASNKEVFAEEFIDGREFNIAVLGTEEGPLILPPAEIKFLDFPENKLKIVGYRAKWVEDSFEYKNTVRSFLFDEKDNSLLETLKDVCIKCWHAFNLKGYARVDFRIDNKGIPYVLEINTNPCISPDSGFVAAVEKAGISYGILFKSIIKQATTYCK